MYSRKDDYTIIPLGQINVGVLEFGLLRSLLFLFLFLFFWLLLRLLLCLLFWLFLWLFLLLFLLFSLLREELIVLFGWRGRGPTLVTQAIQTGALMKWELFTVAAHSNL